MIEFSQSITVQAEPEGIWKALTQAEIVRRYHLAPLGLIEEREAGRIIYGTAEDPMITGHITVWKPFTQLAHTFRFHDHSHLGAESDADTLVTYTLQPGKTSTLLTLQHSGFSSENQTYQNVCGGWPHILQGLKQVIESGR